MRCVTLHQPWAQLVAEGVKTIETRSWATKHRDQLLIHAGRGVADPWPVGAYSGLVERVELDYSEPDYWGLPAGAVVAVARLVDVVPIVGPGERPTRPGLFVEDAATLEGPRLWTCWMRPDGTIDSRDAIERERPWGDFTPGRYAWMLEDVRKLAKPVPAKGRQGVWTPAYDEAVLIQDQLDNPEETPR